MSKSVAFLLVLVSMLTCSLSFPHARSSVEQTGGWSKTYGGAGDDGAMSLIQTSDGGYALAGYTYSVGAGNSDFWLVKTDEEDVIPEFPSWIILPLFTAATLFAVAVKKKAFHITLKARVR
jgi:hypothetical protein